ncbi:hypothetical protein ACG7TL_004894 [Trametes sanguinea]
MFLFLPSGSVVNISASRRKVTGDNFGGSKRAMVVSYSDDNRRYHGHRYANCLYLKDLINWGIPRRPGEPGVLFIVESSLWSAGPQKVFIWLDHSKWLYVGEYELTRAGFLSPQEFKLLPHKVRKKWGAILTTGDAQLNKFRGLRARVSHYNRTGHVLDKEDLADALRAAPENTFQLPQQHMIDALDGGILAMKIWNMKCMGYDEDFQRRIAELASQWDSKK